MHVPLGLDFPTDWTRREPARTTRDVWIGGSMRPLVKFLSSLEVRGLENLSPSTTMIFAANHASHLDTPLILSALPAAIRRRTVVAAAMDTFFMSPARAVSTALFLNAIPIDRHRVNRRSAEIAQSVLDNRWHLLIYPEGGRTTTGTLQEFKGGAALLAQKTHTSVIPTYLHDAGLLMGPRYAKADVFTNAPFRTRHRVIAAFGPALHPLDGEGTRKFGARIHEAVAALGRDVSGDPSYGRPPLT